jgi:hypothetical protein
LQPGSKPWTTHRRGTGLCRSHNRAHHVRRDRKADTLGAAGAREDRRIDADQSSPDVDQRTAGIAGIDGSVGLDEELVVGDTDLGARYRRYDTVSYGLAETERIADGEHDVADLERI